MPKVTDAHRESRRDQILDAALACFAERGFVATSMADLIRASGLSAGAIYSYFEGKREIAIAVGRRAIEARLHEVEAQAGDGAMSPSALIRSVLAGLDRDGIPPSLLVQMWGEAVTDPEFRGIATSAFAELTGTYRAGLAKWAELSLGVDPASADAWAVRAVPAMLGVAQGSFVQRALMADFDADAYFDGLDALMAPPQTSG